MAITQDAASAAFGDLLRCHRLAARLTQEELAERAGMSKRGISDLERGARTRPQRETVKLLAEALALTGLKRAVFVDAGRRGAPAARRRPARSADEPFSGAQLPVPLDPLIGREREAGAVVALLRREDVRLVTLTGPGGVGKTRLALAVATEAGDDFADGVAFVDLAPVRDPALVLPTVADRLGIREPSGRRLAERLRDHLTDRRLLLLLDNLEQVLAAAPQFTDLLAACPGPKILATSRALLRVSGEHAYPVAPLALPDRDPVPPIERLAEYEAVRLFVARAQAADPEFSLTPVNGPAAAEICHRVDGLPLAIELAAARVRLLSTAAVLARLEPRLPLLTGGRRDAPARQQTMRGTIAWSYDLLNPMEQALFRRLAIFVAGWTLEAAEAVASGTGAPDVLEGLATLTEAHLVSRQARDDGEVRFRMLEMVREFGLARLAESGEEPAVRNRHARFFRDLAERTEPKIFETADPALLDLLEREHDNLRAALAWSLEMGDHETLLRLAGALAFFWYYRGYLNEGRRWLSQALETPPDAALPRPRAWALSACGMLANVCGETERATALLTESFPWWEKTDDAYGHALAASMLGGVFVSQGQYDNAAPLFAANKEYFRSAGHENLLAHALFHLGVIAWGQGDDAPARRLLLDAVERFDLSGAPADSIDPLRYLGLMACAAGDLDEAAMWFEDELTRLRQLGSRAAIAVGLADVATLAAGREAWQPAVRLFAKAESLLQAEGAAFSLPARAYYERARERAMAALGNVAQAVTAAGRDFSLDQALTEAMLELARDRPARLRPGRGGR
jgi:predicted ATPase/transcriptional regulator with XRE-family HTH domain